MPLQLRPGHHLELLQGAQAFFAALVADMDEARFEVRLETYIFDFHGSGSQVAEALIRAARRGVVTQLTVDGVGTGRLPASWRSRFEQAGVRWRVFSRLGPLGLLNPTRWRRLHRKLGVIDGRVAYCGGINVLDDYYDPNYGTLAAPRFDFCVRVTGPLVADVHAVTGQLWWRMQALREARLRDFGGAWQAMRASSALAAEARHGAGPARGPAAAEKAGLLLRDNFRHRVRIERAYRRAIGAARHEVIIANAYFLPGGKVRRALIMAARRGVKVQLLLQGRYEYFMQYHAARPVYGALLGAGVEIYEYEPSFLHAKVAVIDGHWATVGSSNLDPLSLLLAREANVVVEGPAFAQPLRERLVRAMAEEGRRIDPADYAHRPLLQRALDRVAFGLMRLALFAIGMRY
ncbi:cardiolipin synthase ClsB [Variovorax terrae]|uniref:Cardiolipin synthase B n=1 Tax=Variovorax terrae TaxID=2923278 RepID=A0A9X2ANQ7_9BURK|nr:cardiolipin synthase ClsB [Variovorax terrae]MCJ0765093.1 cardiolipin synthase ClsB [Variovorax terrae]